MSQETARRYRATWNGAVLAESDQTIVVEGNHYFPPADVRAEHFQASATHTRCHWKWLASYYDVVADGNVNRDAAWYYPEPSKAAEEIKQGLRGVLARSQGRSDKRALSAANRRSERPALNPSSFRTRRPGGRRGAVRGRICATKTTIS